MALTEQADLLFGQMNRFVRDNGFPYSSRRIQDLMTALESSTAAIWFVDVHDHYMDSIRSQSVPSVLYPAHFPSALFVARPELVQYNGLLLFEAATAAGGREALKAILTGMAGLATQAGVSTAIDESEINTWVEILVSQARPNVLVVEAEVPFDAPSAPYEYVGSVPELPAKTPEALYAWIPTALASHGEGLENEFSQNLIDNLAFSLPDAAKAEYRQQLRLWWHHKLSQDVVLHKTGQSVDIYRAPRWIEDFRLESPQGTVMWLDSNPGVPRVVYTHPVGLWHSWYVDQVSDPSIPSALRDAHIRAVDQWIFDTLTRKPSAGDWAAARKNLLRRLVYEGSLPGEEGPADTSVPSEEGVTKLPADKDFEVTTRSVPAKLPKSNSERLLDVSLDPNLRAFAEWRLSRGLPPPPKQLKGRLRTRSDGSYSVLRYYNLVVPSLSLEPKKQQGDFRKLDQWSKNELEAGRRIKKKAWSIIDGWKLLESEQRIVTAVNLKIEFDDDAGPPELEYFWWEPNVIPGTTVWDIVRNQRWLVHSPQFTEWADGASTEEKVRVQRAIEEVTFTHYKAHRKKQGWAPLPETVPGIIVVEPGIDMSWFEVASMPTDPNKQDAFYQTTDHDKVLAGHFKRHGKQVQMIAYRTFDRWTSRETNHAIVTGLNRVWSFTDGTRLVVQWQFPESPAHSSFAHFKAMSDTELLESYSRLSSTEKASWWETADINLKERLQTVAEHRATQKLTAHNKDWDRAPPPAYIKAWVKSKPESLHLTDHQLPDVPSDLTKRRHYFRGEFPQWVEATLNRSDTVARKADGHLDIHVALLDPISFGLFDVEPPYAASYTVEATVNFKAGPPLVLAWWPPGYLPGGSPEQAAKQFNFMSGKQQRDFWNHASTPDQDRLVQSQKAMMYDRYIESPEYDQWMDQPFSSSDLQANIRTNNTGYPVRGLDTIMPTFPLDPRGRSEFMVNIPKTIESHFRHFHGLTMKDYKIVFDQIWRDEPLPFNIYRGKALDYKVVTSVELLVRYESGKFMIWQWTTKPPLEDNTQPNVSELDDAR